jgi:hypothetical protein
MKVPGIATKGVSPASKVNSGKRSGDGSKVGETSSSRRRLEVDATEDNGE